jgi:hypothetical protein
LDEERQTRDDSWQEGFGSDSHLLPSLVLVTLHIQLLLRSFGGGFASLILVFVKAKAFAAWLAAAHTTHQPFPQEYHPFTIYEGTLSDIFLVSNA